MHASPRRILGIDPGLNVTGYAVLDAAASGLAICEAGVIRTTAKASLSHRVAEIHAGLVEVIDAHRPHELSLEMLYSHYARPRTAILMGHARGVICLAAQQAGLSINHYNATQVKKILTGNGRAPKDQMQRAIQRELGLAKPPEPHDVADALAIALAHHHLSKVDVLRNGSSNGAVTKKAAAGKRKAVDL